jgi:LysM repeat protein
MKRRYLLMFVVGTLFSMACTFNTLLPAQAPQPTVEALPTAARPQTAFIDGRTVAQDTTSAQTVPVQNAPQSVAIQDAPAQSAPQSVTSQGGSGYYGGTSYYGCAPRGDWAYSYVVQRGDTLSSIAARAGISWQALAQGNCIANANTIYAGQALRVPYVIAAPPIYPPPHYPPPQYLPPSGGWQAVGSVIPSPFLSLNGYQYQLQGGAVVSLSWAINTYNVTRVEFYFTPSGSGLPPTLIGTDTYFGDGVAISWGVPPGVFGSLSASGFYGSGLVRTTAAYTFVYTNSVQPPPPTPTPQPQPPVVIGSGLSITPYDSVNNNTFILPPDQLITISWPATFPTATDRVVFELVPPGGGAGQPIGLDTNLGDGASILWNSVNGTQGTVRAVAYFQGGYAPQYSDSYYVIAGMP